MKKKNRGTGLVPAKSTGTGPDRNRNSGRVLIQTNLECLHLLGIELVTDIHATGSSDGVRSGC